MTKKILVLMAVILTAGCLSGCVQKLHDLVDAYIPDNFIFDFLHNKDNDDSKKGESREKNDTAESETSGDEDTNIVTDSTQTVDSSKDETKLEAETTDNVKDEKADVSAEVSESKEKTETKEEPVNKNNEKPQTDIKEESQTENTKEEKADAEDKSIEVYENPDWMLILVNPWNFIPENYDVKLKNLKNNQKVDERIYPELQEMMDDMKAEGLSPYICSSYRTHSYQQNLHKKQINKYTSRGYSAQEAYAEASKWVAVPGTSEHETGLAVDIVASYHIVLDESQENTKEQQWLMQNSWKYGFILRYPNNKTNITGIYYEPWHYRYVGKTAAKAIYESGITLEEYLGQ